MRFLSVCSGIEAASVAWMPLGWEPVAFSEIEPFPCAVLTHHYPNVPNWGDMTKFSEWPDASIDLLCGGTPCQSFSVAGLRKELDDPRGSLMLTFGAIAGRYKPRWIMWENVPGVLSSNGGRDFGTFLGMLAQLGYGFAYRVLDAQYFGVPQRRRRVFVVGHLGDWRPAAAVLFERDSLPRNPAPSRKKEEVAPTLTARSARGGGLGADFEMNGGLVWSDLVAKCVTAGEGKQYDWETCNFAVFHPTQDPISSTDGTTHAVTCGSSTGQANIAVAYSTRTANTSSNGWGVQEEVTRPLDTATGVAVATKNLAVRRLTPRECERLQGFPDDYTRIPWRGKPAEQCPDSPRYRALGNSWAVPVVRWIGSRISEAQNANHKPIQQKTDS